MDRYKNIEIWSSHLGHSNQEIVSILKYLKGNYSTLFLDNDLNDDLPVTRLHPSNLKDVLTEIQLDKIKKIMYEFYGVKKGGQYKDESIVELARYFPNAEETIDDIFLFLPEEIRHCFTPIFNEARQLFSKCRDFYIFFQGNDNSISKKTSAIKHVHPPYGDNKYDLTFTTLMAIEITEPINEILHLQWTDYKVKNLQTYQKDYSLALEQVMTAVDKAHGYVTEIPFPDKHTLTHVLFNSTNYVHWTSNLSNNKFLAVVFDGVELL